MSEKSRGKKPVAHVVIGFSVVIKKRHLKFSHLHFPIQEISVKTKKKKEKKSKKKKEKKKKAKKEKKGTEASDGSSDSSNVS